MLKRIVTGLATSVCLSVAAQAAPALWEVQDEDSSVFLFGSVHLLPGDAAWRTPMFDKVLAKAEHVYLETDVSPAGQGKSVALLMERGFNRDGQLLNSIIDEALMAQLREAADTYSMPMGSLLAMRPWLAATTISSTPLLQTGFLPELGVESILEQQIGAENMRFLETVEEQVNVLSGGSDEDQILFLKGTLDGLPTMDEDLNAMLTAWLDGNPDELAAQTEEQFGLLGPATVSRLLGERNANWTEQITDMLARNEQAFLVVGAAHLAGDGSVITMLEDAGLTIKRLQ